MCKNIGTITFFCTFSWFAILGLECSMICKCKFWPGKNRLRWQWSSKRFCLLNLHLSPFHGWWRQLWCIFNTCIYWSLIISRNLHADCKPFQCTWRCRHCFPGFCVVWCAVQMRTENVVTPMPTIDGSGKAVEGMLATSSLRGRQIFREVLPLFPRVSLDRSTLFLFRISGAEHCRRQ